MSEIREPLEVTLVDRAAWRVCDGRLPADDALRVVGYLERKNGAFEAMRVIKGFDWVAFDDFEAALAYFRAQLLDEPGAVSHPLAELEHAPAETVGSAT